MAAGPAPFLDRRIARLALALLIAVALVAAPPAARPALAAGDLRTSADASYELDPDDGRVHVSIRFRVTNLKPSTATTLYYYRDVGFAIQEEARNVRATDGNGAMSVRTEDRKGFVAATVHLRANIYYQDSASFTLRYDLVGGAPRSESPIRVGKAFATFGVWSWGDPGLSTVEVLTPKGFGSQVEGDPMQQQQTASGIRLFASPAEPDVWFSIVTAENRLAYGETRLSLDGGVEVVVRAWPEDEDWDETVSETLRDALPELRELIGLDWPVAHDLSVRERYTPALEGYAGVFFTDDQRIDVSEDLDPLVIVHEASHAWFNDALFHDRWIYEGLAEEYAWRVLTATGGDAGDGATEPDADDPGRIDLTTWQFPQVIRDQETDDRERYGYEAAFWVVHQVADVAGVEGMRAAFEAADSNTIAYVGAPAPEKVAEVDTWRRFLDLVEPIEEPEPASIEAAFRELVLQQDQLDDLDERADARAAYRDLLADGDGWLPPWYVRRQMGEWRFDDATQRMSAAAEVLALRDRVATAASALGLEPDDALRNAYEGATDGFDGATRIGDEELAALAAIDDARARVDAEPDLLTQIGLMGETPRAPYDAARAQFERGEVAASLASAGAAAAIIAGAAAAGQQRVLLGMAVAIAVVVLLMVTFVLLQRRRRRSRLASAAAVPVEPSGTLAPDPGSAADAPAPPPAASPPEVEGG